MPTGAILTIGNELTSGDVVDTNGPWLAYRLERLGVKVALLAAIPDDIDTIARSLRREAAEADFVLVTGGLGGTPDDLTREAVATAFGVGREEVPQLADALRARFTRDPDYAARWAELPVGSRPLENPLGGAPGFQLENVYVLPGLPSEMRAMFDAIEREFAGAPPIGSWRQKFRLRESDIAELLAETGERWPSVLVGSYPSFDSRGPEVEIVLKSDDAKALADARTWLEPQLAERALA
ncbi:MAG: competence/damage-inducible protein A [Gaiellaceae bacterium]